jgi:glycosyltransferase involved in cell wall biosynthesis
MRPYQMWRSGLIQKGISMVDRVIAPSSFMASVFKSRLGVDSKIMPNFVPRPVGLRPADHSTSYYLFASVLERHKGLDLLLKAYQEVDIHSELHVTGKGSLEGLVRDCERKTGGRIKYLGYVSRDSLLSEIASATGFVLPSKWHENSPLSCIEALALGTPLIVSRMGGLPELVDAPQSGLLCNPSVTEISDALRRMEQDSELRETLSRNALKRYESNHTPEHYINNYLQLAEEVLDHAP